MKVLRILLIIVVAIVALFLVIAIFLPAGYQVERSIVINQPDSVVFGYVADYNYWLDWSPWPEMEPNAEHRVSGPAGEVGTKWSWKGEKIGEGSMEIVSIEPYHSMVSKLVFVSPRAGEADDTWTFEPAEGGTRVTWNNQGALDYPVGRWFWLFMEGESGAQFEHGLEKLKKLCEQ